MTSTTEAHVETVPGELSWKLVHTEPGALIYALPGVNRPVRSLVGRVTHRTGIGWAPAGTPATHAEPSEHPALQYAEYLGRVGLLAAALGVGAAVASVPGIAWAEPTDSSSTTSSPSAAATSESATSESDTSSTQTSASTSTTTPTTALSASGGAQTSSTSSSTQTSATSETSTVEVETSTEVSAPGSSSPTAVVRSSGGALTSTTRGGSTEASETAGQQPAASTDQQPDRQSTPRRAPAIHASQNRPRHGSETLAGPVQLPTRGAKPAPRSATSAATTGGVDQQRADANPEGLSLPSATTVSAPMPAPAVTTAQSPSVNTQTAAAMPSPARVNVATDLLGTLGLVPLGTTTSSPAPVESPTTWAVLDVARRQKSQPVIGAVSRALPLANPAEPLTYRVAGGPAHGTVTINPDGTFTYTPSAPGDGDENGLQDSFSVAVRDAHGNTTTVPVTVATDPAATAPAMSLRVSDPGGAGAVHISLTATDFGADQLGHLVVHNPAYTTAATPTATPATTAVTQSDEEAVATIGVGGTPTHIAVSPDGTRAYITNTTGKSVSVIDTTTNAIVATVRVGWTPTQVAVSPDGTRAYITNTTSNTVSVIDTTTNAIVATVRVGWTPTQVAVSPDGTRAYITNTTSKSVSVINTATNTVIATVRVGGTPTQIAVSPNGTRAYVTNTDQQVGVGDQHRHQHRHRHRPRRRHTHPRSRSAPTAPAPTSPTAAASRCR